MKYDYFEKNDLLINEEINQYLDNIIKNNSLANGYIFFGAEGIGKKETAINFISRILKKRSSINNIYERICNNNHPDFLVIKPTYLNRSNAKKNDSPNMRQKDVEIIKVDQIRSIRTFLGRKSIESEKKIVLIVDAHLLNEAASNCLLKTLEEPSNGIFILLTSQISLLLDTVKSRCQLIRFSSFSRKKIEYILKDNLNPNCKILKKLNFQDLVNLANGSPVKLLRTIEIWNEISDDIINKLDFPIKNNLEILKISKSITEELEMYQQICLIELLQHMWWGKTKSVVLVKDLENIKSNLKNNIQPRLSWEVNLLKIGMEIK